MRAARTACRAPARRHYATAAPVRIPSLGLGTWKAQKDQATLSVKTAIENGYRHIDTAFIYGNERFVGKAIAEQTVVPRDQLIIATKLWNTKHRPEDVVAQCDQSLRVRISKHHRRTFGSSSMPQDLGLKHLDVFLLHWPVTFAAGGSPYPKRADGSWIIEDQHPIAETWEAMEGLVQAGKTRAIGVCNFAVSHLKELLADCKIKPLCNQFEMHPYLQQRELVQFCKDNGISITAYSSLGNQTQPQGGAVPLLQNPTVLDIAQLNHRTPSQVLLRWAIQKGACVIPKSVNPERIKENGQVLDWSLSPNDMTRLDALENGTRFVKPDFARYMH